MGFLNLLKYGESNPNKCLYCGSFLQQYVGFDCYGNFNCTNEDCIWKDLEYDSDGKPIWEQKYCNRGKKLSKVIKIAEHNKTNGKPSGWRIKLRCNCCLNVNCGYTHNPELIKELLKNKWVERK